MRGPVVSLAPLHLPVSCSDRLNLTPELINRLAAIRSLLALGDFELVSTAALRLEPVRSEPKIGNILEALNTHRFTEADQLIAELLSSGMRLVEWNDPEIALLEAELIRISTDLADLEAEQADLEHLMARFHAAHTAALGDRIAKLLRLRLEILKRRLQEDPSAAADVRSAEEEYREYTEDHAARQQDAVRTEWKLSDDEQQEMRNLFRAASRRCHPDVVPPEHEEAAAAMFREVRKAYEEGDFNRLRTLAAMAETGFDTGARGPARGDYLRSRIAAVRETMLRTAEALRILKTSETYRIMTTCGDCAAYFARQAAIIDAEVSALTVTLQRPPDERS